MLTTIHEALTALLRTRGGIDPLDVDVSFDMPSEERISTLALPTVDLFLFDVGENTEMRETNPHFNINGGRAQRRMPPRRIAWMQAARVSGCERCVPLITTARARAR